MQAMSLNNNFFTPTTGMTGRISTSSQASSSGTFGALLNRTQGGVDGRFATTGDSSTTTSAGTSVTGLTPAAAATGELDSITVNGQAKVSLAVLVDQLQGRIGESEMAQLESLVTELATQLQGLEEGEKTNLLAELDFSSLLPALDDLTANSEVLPALSQLLVALRNELTSSSPFLGAAESLNVFSADEERDSDALNSQSETVAQFDVDSLREQLTDLLEQIDNPEPQRQLNDLLEQLDNPELLTRISELAPQITEPELRDRFNRLLEQVNNSELGASVELKDGDQSVSENAVTESLAASIVPRDETPEQILEHLQDVINAAGQSPVSITTDDTVKTAVVVSGNKSEAKPMMDARFVSLLQPRQDAPSGPDQGQISSPAQHQSGEVETPPLLNMSHDETKEPPTVIGSEVKTADSLMRQLMQNPQLSPAVPVGLNQSTAVSAVPPVATAPLSPMSAEQPTMDSQIFDQVVTRLAGSFNGESGRMILRLHPAELGSLRLDLQVEGETIRASLQAQTTQVQEVIERNLPQLRQALAEQGLKIEQFQVNIDQQQAGQDSFAGFDRWQEGRETTGGHQFNNAESGEEEELAVPLAQLLQRGGTGISLHV